MQEFAININAAPREGLDDAIAAALQAQAGTLPDEVKSHIADLADIAADAAGLLQADHIGGYISGNHPSGDAAGGTRESITISFYGAEAPPATDVVTADQVAGGTIVPQPEGTPIDTSGVGKTTSSDPQAIADAAAAAQPVAPGASTEQPAGQEATAAPDAGATPAATPSTGAEPGQGGPGDTSAGASPIGPATVPGSVVPDGSQPGEPAPGEEVVETETTEVTETTETAPPASGS